MKNKVKKAISIEAKYLLKIILWLIRVDKKRIVALPSGIIIMDANHMKDDGDNGSNSLIGYKTSKAHGVKTNVYIYKNQELQNKQDLSLGLALFPYKAIALNYEHLTGVFVRTDKVSVKKDQLRTIRHELGHLYEYKVHNDMSEEAAEKYE